MISLREHFIERLIREFFRRAGSGFVLKGGGAIQTLFGSQRLTKDVDLDFTNPKRTADSLHNSVKRAITAAARGLPLRELKVSTPKKSERSPRWKINFADANGRTFHVEVEVSRDPKRTPPGSVVQKPYVPEAIKGVARFWVDIYDQPTLIATKVAALLGREAPRDVYDLDLLIAGATPPSPEQIHWAINRARVRRTDALDIVHGRMSSLSWDRFETELRDALPVHIAERIDREEWRLMKERVVRYLERLLDSARGGEP